jgi:hypothetical protein
MFAPVARQVPDGPLAVVPDVLAPDVLAPDVLVPDVLAPDVLAPVSATVEPEPPDPAGKGSSFAQDEKAATTPSATKGAQPSR